MKSYIQGLITGGVLVFALFVLMGANDNSSEIGKYQISTSMHPSNYYVYETIIDTKTGKVFDRQKQYHSEYKDRSEYKK